MSTTGTASGAALAAAPLFVTSGCPAQPPRPPQRLLPAPPVGDLPALQERVLVRFPLPVQLSVDEESQVVEGMLPAGNAVLPRGSAEMLVLGRTLDGMDWRVLIFSDLRGVRAQAMRYGLLCGVAAAFVQLLGLYLMQRRRLLRQKLEAKQMLERVNTELEHKVTKRTRALSETNARLRKEVAKLKMERDILKKAAAYFAKESM